MKYKILLILVVYCFTNCSTNQLVTIQNIRQINSQEINSVISSYYQGIKEKANISNKIIDTYFGSKDKLVNLFTPEQFFLIRNFNIKSEEDIIRFDKIFSEDEFISMQQQIVDNKIANWSEMLDWNLPLTNAKLENEKVYYLSIPVFNKDKSMAVLYVESRYGGDLQVFKRINNDTWKYIATGLVWVE